MTVQIEAWAVEDLMDGFAFYEKCEPGAGHYFLDRIEPEIRELGNTGGAHRKRNGFHFCASRRFPFGFYYKVLDDQVKVYAVLDCRLNPRTISSILRTR